MALTEVLTAVLKMDASQYKSEAASAAKGTKGISDAAVDAGKRGGGGVSALSGQVKKLGGLVAGAFAAKAVLDFAKGAINSATELEESINAIDVVFEDGAQTLHDYGKTAATSVGLAQSEFNALATNTGALLTNFGFTQQQAADETINLTERAADMASVFNVDVGEALFAVQAGLRGETEPLRRFGVSLDDATIRARAVELGLAATTAEVDKNAKATAALSLFYEQTDKVQGDFANTSGSLANQQRILAAEFENAKAEIGNALLPVMQTLVGVARDLLPAFTDIISTLGGIVAAVAPLIGALGKLVAFGLKPVAAWFDLVADGMEAAAAIFGDLGAKQAIRLAEGLDAISRAAEDGITPTAAYANSIFTLAQEGLLTEESMAELAAAVEFEGEGALIAAAKVLELGRAEGFRFDQLSLLEGALLDGIEASDRTVAAKEELIEKYGLEAVVADRAAAASEGAADGLDDMGDAAEDSADGLDAATEGAQDLVTALGAAVEAQESLSDVLLAAADPAFNAVAAYQTYQQVLKDVDEDGMRTAEEQLELAEAILKAQGSLDAFTAGGVDSAAVAIAEALGITKEAAQDLLRELGILDGFEANAVINVGLTGAGAVAVAGRSITGTLGGVREHGGPVQQDVPFLVGEAGPELFVPGTSGMVVPNAALGGAAGGGGRSLTVNFINPTLANDPMEGVRNAMALDSLEGAA